LEEYVKFLEERPLMDRIKNRKKNIQGINIVSYNEPIMLESGPQKTIYSDDEIKRLEEEAKKVKKSRGWQFMNEYIDSEGNVYHKGKLQPHLKGTKN